MIALGYRVMSYLELSEEDSEIKQGNIVLTTKRIGSKFEINLKMAYKNINITYDGREETKTLNAGATPYKIIIENKDIDSISGKINIDFSVI